MSTAIKFKIAIIAITLMVGLLGFQDGAFGWPWTKDMHDQPSIRPGEMLLNPPEGTLPVNGAGLPMDRMEAGEKLANPVKATEASIANGEKMFRIYCSICHGEGAKGNGPISKKFMPPPDLTMDFFKQRTDGFIYATIVNGGPVMPPYGEDLFPKERWDLVNYLRRLQGK